MRQHPVSSRFPIQWLILFAGLVSVATFQNCAPMQSMDLSSISKNAGLTKKTSANITGEGRGTVWVGLQSWFSPGNGVESGGWGAGKWHHYSPDGVPGRFSVEYWFDQSMYDADELYPTGYSIRAISSGNPKTIDKHVEMMARAEIRGPFLQRFLGETMSDASIREWRNRITQNLRNSSDQRGQTFAVMYDLTSCDDNCFNNFLLSDVASLRDELKVFQSGQYMTRNGRPVIALWGLGFPGSNGQSAVARPSWQSAYNVINQLKAQGFAVMGGVPFHFRTSNGDASTDTGWQNVYNILDIVSPWAVGQYAQASDMEAQRGAIQEDVRFTQARGQVFMPVIFPGFSWHNLSATQGNTNPYNQIPRRQGVFLWEQAQFYQSVGANDFFVAMFDEIDEGTSVFPMATHSRELDGGLIGLDVAGDELPSDYYLRVLKMISVRMQNGIPLSGSFPVDEVWGQVVLYPNGVNVMDYRRAVTALYQEVLGRLPDTGGLMTFEEAMIRGASVADVRNALATSPEGQARQNQIQAQQALADSTAADNQKLLSSHVFNAYWYLLNYPDLKAAFGNDSNAAANHWLTFGINEGRQGAPEVHASEYLQIYGDLSAKYGGTNYRAALLHYLDYGMWENRVGNLFAPSNSSVFIGTGIYYTSDNSYCYFIDPSYYYGLLGINPSVSSPIVPKALYPHFGFSGGGACHPLDRNFNVNGGVYHENSAMHYCWFPTPTYLNVFAGGDVGVHLSQMPPGAIPDGTCGPWDQNFNVAGGVYHANDIRHYCWFPNPAALNSLSDGSVGPTLDVLPPGYVDDGACH